MDPENIIMSVCKFDVKPQNCSGFWKLSSMGWVPEQRCAIDLPCQAEWLVPTSAVLSGWNNEEGVQDYWGRFSIAAVKMNKPNQCTIVLEMAGMLLWKQYL